MKKRLFSLFVATLMVIAAMADGQAKYVFYFIGDGMGVNQINVTETYLAALKGRIGIERILMSEFPVVGLVNTYSATNGVTDSAAGGTALATGKKTKNGAIGMLEDLETPCTSIAAWAKQSGKAVGVATNVAITHATPASFYGHQPSRNMYYEIGQDLCKSGYDFFAGCDFHKPYTKEGEPSLREQAKAAGYTILTGGYKEYMKHIMDGWRPMIVDENGIYHHTPQEPSEIRKKFMERSKELAKEGEDNVRRALTLIGEYFYDIWD